MTEEREFLKRLFAEAVSAADPALVIAANVPPPIVGRTVVIAFGKAAVPMARAYAAVHPHDTGLTGLVVAPDCAGAPEGWEKIKASHPIPDAGSFAAANRAMELASGLGVGDRLVALVSGGGSSLLSSPAIPNEDKQQVTRALLSSGASISEMNAVRKHLSMIKGGRLAALAHPAEVISFVLSDIPGDDPALVASGPTLPDAADLDDAMRAIHRYGIVLPASASAHLASENARCPSQNDPAFARDRVVTVGTAGASLSAAARLAREEGIPAYVLSDRIEGEARQAGAFHAALARQILAEELPFSRPCVLLSGGETTVTVRSKGRGGRNGEFALAAAIGLAGCSGVYGLAADTDGRDGSEDNAGCFFDGTSAARMESANVSPGAALEANDSWAAFDAAGDLFVTGPTGTNVNDFRAILVL